VLSRPIVTLLDATPDAEAKIVHAARTCTNSHDKSTPESDARLLKSIIKRGHLSVLEHAYASFECTFSRVVLAQISRHRHLSLSVESERYCKVSGNSLFLPDEQSGEFSWELACWLDESYRHYCKALELGLPKQIARYVLPNATLTTAVVTANFRSWRELLQKRLGPEVQPEFRELSRQIRDHLLVVAPVVFEEFSEQGS
jgi:thymidylate synthase (FAD)